MRFAKAVFALAVLSVVATAADPPAVRLPEVQVIPAPGNPIKLTSAELFVFDTDVPCVVTTSPPGLLSVTKEDGPVKVKGVFAGGNGKVETRTFKGKFVYTVDVTGTGRAELLVFPAGVADEGGILRRMIDANNGSKPPPVDPVNPPVVKGKLFGWVLIEETSQAGAWRGKALQDAITWSDANGVKHRTFDVSGPVPEDIKPYMDRARGKALPQVFLVTESGELLYGGDCPKTATGLPDLLKKYKGE